MSAFAELRALIGIAPPCVALSTNRTGIYRAQARLAPRKCPRLPRRCRPRPPLALSEAERCALLLILNTPRFADLAPAAVFAILLDEGCYYGSIRTMYRLPARQSQTGERRKQRAHAAYVKPELLAIRPREVWSWDITKLKGPAKWTCFHLHAEPEIMPSGAGFRAQRNDLPAPHAVFSSKRDSREILQRTRRCLARDALLDAFESRTSAA